MEFFKVYAIIKTTDLSHPSISKKSICKVPYHITHYHKELVRQELKPLNQTSKVQRYAQSENRKGQSSNDLRKRSPNLLDALALRHEQAQQDARMLRVQVAAGNLGLVAGGRDLTVAGAGADDDGDLRGLDDVGDGGASGRADGSCAGAGELFGDYGLVIGVEW